MNRRTFLRLAAAGLSSAAVQLAACVEMPSVDRALLLPTPELPLTPPHAWYVVSLRGAAEVDVRDYRLHVTGMVRDGRTFSLGDLRTGFEPTTIRQTLSCVGDKPTGALLSSAYFRGARMVDVAEAVGAHSDATAVSVHALDGYIMSRSTRDMWHPDTLLAYEIGTDPDDMVPLPVANGFPLRMMTPSLYGWVQPKWLSSITFTDDDHISEVVRRSSAQMEGRMQLRAGFSLPHRDQVLPAGCVRCIGYAFGDGRPLGRVEMRVDDGPWLETDLVWNSPEDEEHDPRVWSLWRYFWDASPGAHDLSVRVFYADGEGQLAGRAFPYSSGSMASVSVHVDQAAPRDDCLQ